MTAGLLDGAAQALVDANAHRTADARSSSCAWERRVRRRVALTDALAVYSAVLVAFWIRFGAGEFDAVDQLAVRNQHAITSMVLIVVWLAALWFTDSLDLKLMGAGSQEYVRVTNVTMAVFGGAAIAAYLSRWALGRTYVAIALPLGLILLNLGRYAMRRVLVAERRDGRSMSRAIAVGSRGSVEHLISELRRASQAGIEIVGAFVAPPVDGSAGSADNIGGVPVVGDFSSVATYVAANSIDTVVVTGSDDATPKALKRLAWDLEPYATDLVLAPGLTDVAGPRIHTRPVPGVALLHVAAPGYTEPQLRLKRAGDIVGSALLIFLFSLPMAATALAIKATSPGPVLFRQIRVGVNGEHFSVLKFRSMCADAEKLRTRIPDSDVGLFYKPKDDPRITPIGRFIRRFSIDELPQLFNVLTGSMSLVGPRPFIPAEVESGRDGTERRLFVKPGMTGLWQVSGRSDLDPEESMRLDLYYVENWSITEDLMILARTIKAVVRRDGAY